MATITPLALAALGLLAERPMHPYEMYQLLVEREEDRLVKVRPGSLYHAVDRLAETGLVEPMATERAGNRPERTRFRITDDGRLALTERITEMLASPAIEYPEFPLAIAQAHNLPLDEVRACIRTRIKRLTLERHQYDEGASLVRGRGVPRRFWIDVEYQRAMCDASISWLQRMDSELDSGALSWDEPHAHPPPAGAPAGDPGTPPCDPGTSAPPPETPGDPGTSSPDPGSTPRSAIDSATVGALEDDEYRRAPRRRGRPPRPPSTGSGSPPAPSPDSNAAEHIRTTHEDHR